MRLCNLMIAAIALFYFLAKGRRTTGHLLRSVPSDEHLHTCIANVVEHNFALDCKKEEKVMAHFKTVEFRFVGQQSQGEISERIFNSNCDLLDACVEEHYDWLHECRFDPNLVIQPERKCSQPKQ